MDRTAAFVSGTVPSSPFKANLRSVSGATCTQTFLGAKKGFSSFEGLKSAKTSLFSYDETAQHNGVEIAEDVQFRIEMGGNLRALRDRIGSVKNTIKITEAMKLVAAAKVRKAQEVVLGARPFSEAVVRVLYSLQDRVRFDEADLPLLKQRPVKKVTLIVISGDRGLCGSYNSNINKQAELRFKELKEQGVEVELVTIGNKSRQYFTRREYPLERSWQGMATPTGSFSTEISEYLLRHFLTENTDRVELIYTKFINLIASKPVVQTVLPLQIQGLENEYDEIFRLSTREGQLEVQRELVPMEYKPLPSDMIYEGDPIQILNAVFPLYLNAQIFRALTEAVCSELGQRMTAMSAATDNAKTVVKNLLIESNKLRQAKITQEILEVVSGAAAVTG